MSGCPPVVSGRLDLGNLESACHAFDAAVVEELPALTVAGLTGLLLASREFGFPGAKALPEKLAAWRSGLQQILATARSLDLRVLMIAPIPVFALRLPECLAHALAAECGGSRAILERKRAPLLAAVRAVAADFDNVRVWDPFDLFCDSNVCTPVRDGMIMYANRGHLSVVGSRALAAFAAPQLDWLRGW